MNNEMILQTLPKENIKKKLTEDSVIRKIRTTADYRQSKRSHNLWDKFKRLKKTTSRWPNRTTGNYPHHPHSSILEHTAHDGKNYLQDENYISDFDKEIKRIEGRE